MVLELSLFAVIAVLSIVTYRSNKQKNLIKNEYGLFAMEQGPKARSAESLSLELLRCDHEMDELRQELAVRLLEIEDIKRQLEALAAAYEMQAAVDREEYKRIALLETIIEHSHFASYKLSERRGIGELVRKMADSYSDHSLKRMVAMSLGWDEAEIFREGSTLLDLCISLWMYAEDTGNTGALIDVLERERGHIKWREISSRLTYHDDSP